MANYIEMHLYFLFHRSTKSTIDANESWNLAKAGCRTQGDLNLENASAGTSIREVRPVPISKCQLERCRAILPAESVVLVSNDTAKAVAAVAERGTEKV